MRSPVRLLLAFLTVVTLSSAGLGVGVVALVSGSGVLGLAGAVVTVSPTLDPTSAALPSAGESLAAARAVAWALDQLGTPYRWGGEGDGGFDCSGLVQAAFGAAGIHLPRVAQDQYNVGPHLPPRTPLQAGDLVFFGSSGEEVDHVGIVVSTGEMVDAPHTGAFVRVEPIFSNGYVGATRPAP
jgi:cell wall-associated NlpC family hydrolase